MYHTIVKRVATKSFERVNAHEYGAILKLTVRDIWVKGWPHNAAAIIRRVGTQTLPGGAPYENHGVHVIRMRWGRVVDIDANEDSPLVAETLKNFAAQGIGEAFAEPIVS
jgi:hypothetical protein